MNQKLLTLAVASLLGYGAYAQSVNFQFDAAGNQTERKYICINCLQTQAAETVIADSMQLRPELKIYPNPVLQSLTITWSAGNKNTVREIHLYNANGVLLSRKRIPASQNRASLPFNHLPAGTYVVQIRFNNGKLSSTPIIKQ